MTGAAIAEYEARHDGLVTTAIKLSEIIQSHLEGVVQIDRISTRAKEPLKFAEKAGRRSEKGVLKYPAPLTEIQDQIGARITVLYLHTVKTVADKLKEYFRPIEQRNRFPESNWEFGYFGTHFLFALPHDAIPKDIPLNMVPDFFELQIKTVFQHAWSEANHDLGYKSLTALTSEQQRRLAFASAQAWGADEAFDHLLQGFDR